MPSRKFMRIEINWHSVYVKNNDLTTKFEWCVEAGALKELLDKLGLGTPEWKDFVATIDGCLSGFESF